MPLRAKAGLAFATEFDVLHLGICAADAFSRLQVQRFEGHKFEWNVTRTASQDRLTFCAQVALSGRQIDSFVSNGTVQSTPDPLGYTPPNDSHDLISHPQVLAQEYPQTPVQKQSRHDSLRFMHPNSSHNSNSHSQALSLKQSQQDSLCHTHMGCTGGPERYDAFQSSDEPKTVQEARVKAKRDKQVIFFGVPDHSVFPSKGREKQKIKEKALKEAGDKPEKRRAEIENHADDYGNDLLGLGQDILLLACDVLIAELEPED